MFSYIHYIPSLVKSQKPQILGTEDKILMNTISKNQPHIRYILGDMIPPRWGSSLFHNLSLNRIPGENCNILGDRGPNGIIEDVPEREWNLIYMI